MKHLLKLSLVFCLFVDGSIILGQSTIPASGGNASGSGGTVSYSVGQLVYMTNSSTAGSVSQGVQQPYEISVINALEKTESINLVCSVYPNPFTDLLTLKIANYEDQQLSYQLYNLGGILLENKIITGYEMNIPLSSYLSGTYFLKISDAGKEIKIFKIIKN